VSAQTIESPANVRRAQWSDALLRLLVGLVTLSAIGCRGADSTPSTSSAAPIILLFTGRGTSANDVAALERLLRDNHYGYATADSERLDAMNESDLRAHRLLIVPGGNFEQMGHGLAQSTPAHLRDAIRSGLNYLGICAGAFFAGNSPFNGLNLSSGVRFPFYSAEDRGIRKAAVAIAAAGMPTLEHYWEDGPQLTGWGEVVAKYPDGTPAVVQGTFGEGRVILSGIHPEAPESWRRGMRFTTPASVDNEYAVTLIDAALDGKALAHY
jgi:glutamine amidotransferase-like uncharacterized protein